MAPPEAEVGSVVVMAPPTPGTPGTPGGPLITGMRVDSMSFDHRKPIPRCKCLPVMGSTWGQHDTCFTDFPSPNVSLTRKVSHLPLLILFYSSFFSILYFLYIQIIAQKIN